jgi:hypothetical protein
MVGGGFRLKLLELPFDGRQIGVDRFFRQAHLLAAELFVVPG